MITSLLTGTQVLCLLLLDVYLASNGVMDVIVGSRQVEIIFDNVPHMGIAHNVVAILCRYPMQIVFPASHRMQKVGVCQVKIARQDVLHGLALLWWKGCSVQLLESEDQAILLESHTCFRRFARDVMMRLGRTTDRMAIGQEDWLLVHKSSQAHLRKYIQNMTMATT